MPLKKISLIAFVLVLGIIILFFPSKHTNNESKTGNNKIISLAPNITEILCYLDAEKRIVGITNDCNYPPGIKNKEKIGKYTYPNIEKIVLLQPATVIAENTIDKRFLKKLKENDISYQLYNFKNLATFFSEMNNLNKNLNLNKSQKIEKLKKEYQSIKPVTENKTVLILVWQNPYIAVGKNIFLSEYFKKLGFKNIIKQKDYPYISQELIYKEKPDTIINLSGKKLQLESVNVINNLDPDIMLRLSPRLIEYHDQIQL